MAFISLLKPLPTIKSRLNKECVLCNLRSELSIPQPYINSAQIKEVREKYRLHEKDTGSPEYQIAALTVRIAYMTAHVKKKSKRLFIYQRVDCHGKC
mmetsp:Transcript_149/g.262  ORF Transcript_149/g.262 Transcript_149/m.262 type:complete len:97 (-) Transcript_149:654-944(-)